MTGRDPDPPELDNGDDPITWAEIDAMHALFPLVVRYLIDGRRVGGPELFIPRGRR